MTNIDLTAGGRTSRLAYIVRIWWPVPACMAGSLVAQQLLLTSRYDVGGHAAGHADGATAPFLAAALLPILFWATRPARRQVDLIAVGALWLATTLLVMVGNLRVVDDLVDAGYSHTPTGSLHYEANHSLANSSVWYAEAAALVLIAAWRRRRHIGNRATLGAVLTTLVIPPWIIPGAGVVVLAIVRLVRRHRAAEVVSATVGRGSSQRADNPVKASK